MTPDRKGERRGGSSLPRLPDGIRTYIRRLKEQGQTEEAETVRAGELDKARRKAVTRRRREVEVDGRIDRARAVLPSLAGQVEQETDPLKQARIAARATWFLGEAGEIDLERRSRDLEWLMGQHPQLEDEMRDIRDEVMSDLRG